jgi:hypothetical protein
MAPRITRMTWDDYKNRDTVENGQGGKGDKPLDSEEDRLLASFDIKRGSQDSEEYAGNDPKGPLQERMAIIPLVRSHPLHPPHVTFGMDDTTAAKSTYAHFRSILEAGGPRGLKLVRELASAGNTAVQRSRDMGLDGSFGIPAGHKGVSHVISTLVETALDVYPPSREDALNRGKDFRTNDGESVAKTIAKAKAAGLGSREGIQKLPTDASKVDFKRFVDALDARAKPQDMGRLHPNTVAQMLEPANFVKETDDTKANFGFIVGVGDKLARAVPEAYHDMLIDRASSGNKALRSASLPIPPSAIQGNAFKVEGISLARAVFADKDGVATMKKRLKDIQDTAVQGQRTEEVLVGSMKDELEGAAKGPGVRLANVAGDNKKRVSFLEKQGYGTKAAEYLVKGEQLIAHADVVDFALGKAPNELNLFLLGYAAKQGKLGQVTQGDKTLSLSDAMAIGVPAHKDNGEMMRAAMAQGLDAHASEPTAALALDIMRSEAHGKMSTKDIKRLQTVDMNLMEIVALAGDKDKAAGLMEQTGVSAQAIQILADSKAVADAGRNLPHIQTELMQRHINILGPEHYPQSMRGAANMPPYLLMSGDPEAFAALKGVVGIVGETLGKGDKDVEMAATIAPHMAALAQTGAPRMWVEGATPFPIEPRRGDVIVVPGGQPSNDESQAARDAAGAFTVYVAVPSELKYQPPKTRAKNDKGSEVVAKNMPHPTYMAHSGAVVGAMADRVVVTNGRETGAYTAVGPALLGQLQSGKRVAVVEPRGNNRETSPITAGLANHTGRKALDSAGYGASIVESADLAKLDGGPVAMRLSNSKPAAAAAALVAIARGERPTPVAAAERTQDQVR